MYSSKSKESDSGDIKRINFNEFLYVRHHKYEWKDFEFDALEKKFGLSFS